MKIMKTIAAIMLLACCTMASAQKKFFNLTAEEVKIDTLLPYFTYTLPIGYNYADSTYTVTIEYPEFMDMNDADIARYKSITDKELPELPDIKTMTTVERKRGVYTIGFVPLVCREGKMQKLVSFMLNVKASKNASSRRKTAETRAEEESGRYAEHSVLATGKWAKIRVPESGVYQLTDALIQHAGFSDLSKVKVYGYGGNLQPEKLSPSYLTETDDLQEVPLCIVDGKRLFYALGPVSYNSKTVKTRVRNYCSDYGYYFITQSESEPQLVDSAAFVASYYPSPSDYHSLFEKDEYAWFEGGRNLYLSEAITPGSSKTYTVSTPGYDTTGNIRVTLSVGGSGNGRVVVNGNQETAYTTNRVNTYDKAEIKELNLTVQDLKAENTITIYNSSGADVRLDNIVATFSTPWPRKPLTGVTFPVPEYVYNITNQDLHQDRNYQMVIIIPTSQKLLPQAERLKSFHEQHDGLNVRIVPADELFNEFSSGTPDVNAYRRYLKMLYDRAESDEQMPQSLLLFGDGVWDNRLTQQKLRSLSTDDLLLCYESENSVSKANSYCNEGYFACLDDDEGDRPIYDRPDIGVGRFPVRTAEQAKTMVDKTISYGENQYAGDWENTVVVMGDDGNDNKHMETAYGAGVVVEKLKPGMVVKPIMWDAYDRVTTSTGATYPEVSKLVKEYQANGALVMDYIGHASEQQVSHEVVLKLSDFKNFSNTRLPLWITSSCDVAPFDGLVENIGEEVVLNKKGGAVAYFGSARTVFITQNDLINRAFMRFLFSKKNGRHVTLGEAQRLAKNYLLNSDRDALLEPTGAYSKAQDATNNKLQYLILGDPALHLQIPELDVVVDSINNIPVGGEELPALKAGGIVSMKGHVEQNGEKLIDYNGTVTALVRDASEHIVCKMSDKSTMSSNSTAFEYDDRTKVLFNGSNVIKNGEFTIMFAMPKDISYTDERGKINLFTVNNEKTLCGNGACEDFIIGGSEQLQNDSIGPSIYCYLNSRDFVDGGNVNETPYFVAEVNDKDGLNTSGNGIGHDLELIIDNDMNMTYNLNNNFVYDFGSYTSGSTHYSIPQLTPGKHSLRFRAWDILNNSNSATLNFNVVKGLQPDVLDVTVTNNPARTSTTFIITHDRSGSDMDIQLEIFDMSGRLLYKQEESGVSTTNTYTINWDLTIDGGGKLQTGVYLYRALMSCDGGTRTSKAKKLVIIQ